LRFITLDEIRRVLVYPEIIGRMRDALVAQSRGECDTPMPMHLEIPAKSALSIADVATSGVALRKNVRHL